MSSLKDQLVNLFREKQLLNMRTIRGTQKHYVGRLHSFDIYIQ
jgi:hypothetical protein